MQKEGVGFAFFPNVIIFVLRTSEQRLAKLPINLV